LVESLWRTLKDEEVYIRADSDGWEAEISPTSFQWRYCHVRPHSSLGVKIPNAVYTYTKPNPSLLELTVSGAETVHKR